MTEEAAIKAVEDGLAGRNVPIVHEEIRVVLAMALERDALRARVAELERERDEAAAEAAACVEFLRTQRDWHSFWEEGFLGEKTASASRQNGQALRAFLDETGHARRVVERLASMERERDEANTKYANWRAELKAEVGTLQAACHRLKEALRRLLEVADIRPMVDNDDACQRFEAARAALASTPSAEPVCSTCGRGRDESPYCSNAFHFAPSAPATVLQNAENSLKTLRALGVGELAGELDVIRDFISEYKELLQGLREGALDTLVPGTYGDLADLGWRNSTGVKP